MEIFPTFINQKNNSIDNFIDNSANHGIYMFAAIEG